jgi:aspartate/methionine/tyrosine aminotransferase
VISDEIYNRIIYEGAHESIASLPGMKERTILLDGFSKTYAMTGWRLGYGVMHEDLAQKITQLMVNSNSCTCAFVQKAGIEALTGPQEEAENMVAEFKKRRDVIVPGLNDIPGISCNKPLGTFYVFPNITGTGMDSRKLSDYLLNNAGVALLPGTAIGENGEGYLRLSFANSIENIKKALRKISLAVEHL